MLSVFSLTVAAQDTKYEKRIENRKERWNKLIPRYSKVQFAGSMGLISAGSGWSYGKNDCWETDFLIGYVPKYSTNEGHLTLTLKQNFIPQSIVLKRNGFFLEPFTSGLYLNAIFGEHFWSKQPERYPTGYYGFTSKFRFNICIGQRIGYVIPEEKRHFAKSYSVFYEISTCDLYLIEAANNRSLPVTNFLHLSLGLKIQLF